MPAPVDTALPVFKSLPSVQAEPFHSSLSSFSPTAPNGDGSNSELISQPITSAAVVVPKVAEAK